MLEKAERTLDFHKIIVRLRRYHQDVVEAKIRLIEVNSDISTLTERNSAIVEQVAREEELVRHVEQEAKRVKDKASKAMDVCKEIQADPENESIIELIREDLTMSIETLEQEIGAEQSKLDFMQASNPRAIEQYEARQRELDTLREHMEQKAERLQALDAKIARTRSRWEPELDALIAKISEAFSYNFEQIGCAGEVSVHKDEDFELWAIQIKVRFRYVVFKHNNTIQSVLTVPTENTKHFSSWTHIANQEVSGQSPQSSTSCPCNQWRGHHSALSTRSIKAWTRVTSEWSTSVWWRLLAKNILASISSSRLSSWQV